MISINKYKTLQMLLDILKISNVKWHQNQNVLELQNWFSLNFFLALNFYYSKIIIYINADWCNADFSWIKKRKLPMVYSPYKILCDSDANLGDLAWVLDLNLISNFYYLCDLEPDIISLLALLCFPPLYDRGKSSYACIYIIPKKDWHILDLISGSCHCYFS